MPFVKLEAILFDLGRVIVDFDMAECESTLIAHSNLDPDRFLRAVWDTGWIRRYETGHVTTRDFYDFLVRDGGLEMDYEAFYVCWTEVFDPVPIIKPDLLERLGRQYPMTLVSNTNEAHADYVRQNYDVFRHFGQHVLSYQVGSLKPDPRMLECAIKAADRPPEAMLFIDDRQENIQAGDALGLQTHRFRSLAILKDYLTGLGVEVEGPE